MSAAGVQAPTQPSPYAERPPLPVAELDAHRNRLMGLKIIAAGTGAVDERIEGIEGKHWIREENLPKYSQVNCERYYPYQAKRIMFETNAEGIITWVRYL